MQDKDHWKKETAARIRDTKERMQKLTENQLETLTKRTILENEQMDAEMRYQSRQVGRGVSCRGVSSRWRGLLQQELET